MPKGGHSNLLLQWMEYMACLFLFQEISTHRTETIYQHTRFQTYTTMHSIRFLIQTVAGRYNFFHTIDDKLKFSTFHISHL